MKIQASMIVITGGGQGLGQPAEIASTTAFSFDNDYLSGRMIGADGTPPL